MKIVVASTRQPKINGVKRGIEKLHAQFSEHHTEIVIVSSAAESGVSDTPKSLEELCRGAYNRAFTAFNNVAADLSIGVEGGLFLVSNAVFLQSWACVYDGAVFHFGSSGAIELPDSLAEKTMSKGQDLGIVIDEFAQRRDVRSTNGTFGILSNDVYTREDSFAEAVVFALLPFWNSSIYSR